MVAIIIITRVFAFALYESVAQTRLHYYYNGMTNSARLPLPHAWIHADALKANINQLSQLAAPLKIRIASKSVRVKGLLQELLKDYPHLFHGILAYHPAEALWLAESDIKDIVVGYPYLEWFYREHNTYDSLKEVTFMADRLEHLEALSHFAKQQNQNVQVCLDIDLTTKHFGIYFGVYRSSLRDLETLAPMLEYFKNHPELKLRGVMGYEAQIAGVGDKNPFKAALNPIVRFLKNRSWPKVKARRQMIVQKILSEGFSLDFVNGGGTGSLHITKTDSSVTEVAAGSGLFNPLLFDYYQDFHFEAAAGFQLEVTRQSYARTVTAAGGGYIASGAPGIDRLPRPINQNLSLDVNEGAGEVQTPLHIQAGSVPRLGSAVEFRHAKAGELCERFNTIYYIEGETAKPYLTYRGEGQCFL